MPGKIIAKCVLAAALAAALAACDRGSDAADAKGDKLTIPSMSFLEAYFATPEGDTAAILLTTILEYNDAHGNRPDLDSGDLVWLASLSPGGSRVTGIRRSFQVLSPPDPSAPKVTYPSRPGGNYYFIPYPEEPGNFSAFWVADSMFVLGTPAEIRRRTGVTGPIESSAAFHFEAKVGFPISEWAYQSPGQFLQHAGGETRMVDTTVADSVLFAAFPFPPSDGPYKRQVDVLYDTELKGFTIHANFQNELGRLEIFTRK